MYTEFFGFINKLLVTVRSCVSSVAIVTRLWAGRSGAGNFSLHHHVQNGSGAQPASYPVGTGGSFPGVKWLGYETDLSPPFSAKVKNACIYTSTPPIRLHDVVLS
jgi:hypothetical protein